MIHIKPNDEAPTHKIPDEYATLPWTKKRVININGYYKYVKSYYDNGVYWISETSVGHNEYFALSLNTSGCPCFWKSNDFGALRVSIDWLIDNGIDIGADPIGNYDGYVRLIKTFWPDYLHLVLPKHSWKYEWNQCLIAEEVARIKYMKLVKIKEQSNEGDVNKYLNHDDFI